MAALPRRRRGGKAPRLVPTVASSWYLEPALASDLGEIGALEGECYSDPWPASSFASLPDNDRVFFVVARRAPKQPITGYVVAWYVLDEAELANLAVAPGHRRGGMGRSLLDAALHDAERRRVANMYLEVRDSNTAARRLYASRQFVEIGRRKGYYRTPVEDALILRRTFVR